VPESGASECHGKLPIRGQNRKSKKDIHHYVFSAMVCKKQIATLLGSNKNKNPDSVFRHSVKESSLRTFLQNAAAEPLCFTV
jgi:hypothetical protein